MQIAIATLIWKEMLTNKMFPLVENSKDKWAILVLKRSLQYTKNFLMKSNQ